MSGVAKIGGHPPTRRSLMLRKVLASAFVLSMAIPAALAQDGTGNPQQAQQPQRGPGMMFNRLDENGDGAIAPEEFGSDRIDMLKAADADGDGTLTQEELVTYVMNREFQRQARRAERRLDIDGDGKVTIAEIEDYQKKHFALLDRDSDGKLSQDELRRSFLGRMAGMHDGDRPRFAMRRDWHGPRHF